MQVRINRKRIRRKRIWKKMITNLTGQLQLSEQIIMMIMRRMGLMILRGLKMIRIKIQI